MTDFAGAQRFDHTALAVESIEAALPLYRDLLGGELRFDHTDARAGFRAVQLRYPNGARLELLEPAGERSSFLRDFLAQRGEGAHHLTYLVEDLRAAVAAIRAAGYRVVDEDYANPAWQQAFISPVSAHGTIVQLAQSSLSPEERDHAWHVPETLE
jgi:methylmalonyl-CoA/ethylmalonyl-CoA epimerase